MTICWQLSLVLIESRERSCSAAHGLGGRCFSKWGVCCHRGRRSLSEGTAGDSSPPPTRGSLRFRCGTRAVLTAKGGGRGRCSHVCPVPTALCLRPVLPPRKARRRSLRSALSPGRPCHLRVVSLFS